MTTIEYLPEIYKKHFGEKAKIIFDIGSRDGNDAYFLYKELNAESVYVFEAHPECYKNIKNDYPHFNVVHVAVSDFQGEALFNAIYTNILEAGISSLRDRNDSYYDNQDTRKVKVNVNTMNNLMNEYDILDVVDLVKIDVEGCSYEVVNGFEKKLNNIKMIHIELEEVQYWKDQKLAADTINLLNKNNFRLIDSRHFTEHSIDQIWINKRFEVNSVN